LRWRNAHLLLENALGCGFGLTTNRLGDGSDRTQRLLHFVARQNHADVQQKDSTPQPDSRLEELTGVPGASVQP
jgi:hypothetical protein